MTSSDLDPSQLAPLPTFLIIGAQKSATRWLRHNLGQHPDVFAAATEISYFNDDRRYALGSDFYRAQYAGWAGESIRGESTPGYLMWRHQPPVVAERIGQIVPDVALIAVLRNPIDRAQSALRHHIDGEAIPPSTDLLTHIRTHDPVTDRLGIIAGGWYAASLQPFVDRFGDRLLVLLHDDIATDAPGVYDRARHHVGAAAGFVPAELAAVRNSNQRPIGARGLRTDADLSSEDRVVVYDLYRDDLARLEDLIQRDLSIWDPTRVT